MQLLNGVVKNYDWGSLSALPSLLGRDEDGLPQAEYWLGAHPAGPGTIDGLGLDDIIAADPKVLGVDAQPGDELPFLVKLLAAARPLSLQAHPDRAEAEDGFARENAAEIAVDAPNRNYRDPRAKHELLVALTPFEALAGFRDPAWTVELFEGLGLRHEALDAVVGPLRSRSGPAAIGEVFLDSLIVEGARRQWVSEVVAAAVRHQDAAGEFGAFARTAVVLDEYYPGNPGVIAALLMNLVTLSPGEALYLRPGIMHAYLQGTAVEVMVSSDNVLRGGLTNKHIDVAELARVVDFTPSAPQLLVAEPVSPGLARYPDPVDEFDVWRLELTPVHPTSLPGDGRARVLIIIDGHLCVSHGGQHTELVQGEAAFIAASDVNLGLTGDCLAILTVAG